MSFYYFHLHETGRIIPDRGGRDLPDLQAVQTTTLAEGRAIIGADALSGRIDLGCSIEVADAHGGIVHRLRFADAVKITGLAGT